MKTYKESAIATIGEETYNMFFAKGEEKLNVCSLDEYNNYHKKIQASINNLKQELGAALLEDNQEKINSTKELLSQRVAVLDGLGKLNGII